VIKDRKSEHEYVIASTVSLGLTTSVGAAQARVGGERAATMSE
jgi:hypothetical protein